MTSRDFLETTMTNSNTIEINGKAAKAATNAAKATAAKQSKAERTKPILAIKKFKLTEDGASIEFTQYDGGAEPKLCSVKIEEEVHPDLIIKLNQLMPKVIDAIGLDEKMWKDGVITGVGLKRAGDISGCTISCKAEIGTLHASLTTPFLSVSSGLADAIQLEDVCAEIELCIAGKRAQGNLWEARYD